MRQLKQLKTKKGRDETGLFIVEGEKFVSEIPPQWHITRYVATERFAASRDLSMYKNRAPIEVIKDSQFDSISDTVTPQGILAICKQTFWSIADLLTHAKPNGFLLFGEHLNDPGNIGALVRTVAAAGACGMILSKNSGELYNPKVVRAAAGALLRLPIVTDVDAHETIAALRDAGYATYAAHLHGDVLPYGLNLKNKFCFLVGNESHGLSPKTATLADAWVRLPMAGEVESLNASVAGSILLYEAVRQRLS